MQGNAERRQSARLPHSSRLKVKDVATGTFRKGMLINFSKNGLFFESNSPFDPGTEVFIAIEDSPFDAPVAGQDFYLAVIKHCRELDEGSYFLYGCGAELVRSYGTAVFSGRDAE